MGTCVLLATNLESWCILGKAVLRLSILHIFSIGKYFCFPVKTVKEAMEIAVAMTFKKSQAGAVVP